MSSGSVLLLAMLLTGYLYWSIAQPTNTIEMRCKFAPPSVDTTLCAYGVSVNICNKAVCLQGPGDVCGADDVEAVRFGHCAHGLRCCNGLCRGCINGMCFLETCRPRNLHGLQLRSDPAMPERRMDPLYRLFDY